MEEVGTRADGGSRGRGRGHGAEGDDGRHGPMGYSFGRVFCVCARYGALQVLDRRGGADEACSGDGSENEMAAGCEAVALPGLRQRRAGIRRGRRARLGSQGVHGDFRGTCGSRASRFPDEQS
eukprot:6184774-Pyramimonas_sp.AAC.1